ncbi:MULTISPECIES: hypothetical protein [Acidithrix]|uniref:Protease HtpX n=1 Tax=Acidithrix ferrooxidans TaxID=1280514 RepID=A0A0D8HJF9_9ACTN|nr:MULTISPECIES: hypothetical protein [Acidithrix]KJF18078.1 protease HtpX [Acidithrix ferrooxidans]CAG4930117.1 unnamed protein product [Acidithrix sp. C25]
MSKQGAFKFWGGVKGFDTKAAAAELLTYFMVVSGIVGAVLGIVIGSLVAIVGVPDKIGLLIGVIIVAGSLVFGSVSFSQGGADETRFLGLTELSGDLHPRVVSLLEGLSATVGIDMPGAYLLDEPQINTVAIVGPGRQGAFVVTSGALELLTRMELEAIIARELVKIRTGQVQYEARLRAFQRTMGKYSQRFVPSAHSHEMLGRDIANDIGGITITRFPPALISAMERAEEISVRPSKDTERRLFAQFWFIPEFDDIEMDQRIAELSGF